MAERFWYDYSDRELNEIADRAQGLARQADEVHVVFNNNARDFAPKAAEAFRKIFGQVPKAKRKWKESLFD